MAELFSLAEHLLNVKGAKVVNCDLSEMKSKNIITLDIAPQRLIISVRFVAEFVPPMIMVPKSPDYDHGSKKPRLWRANDWRHSSHAQISPQTHCLPRTQGYHRICALGIPQITFYS